MVSVISWIGSANATFFEDLCKFVGICDWQSQLIHGLSLLGLARRVQIPNLGWEGVMSTQSIQDLARRPKDTFLDA